VAEKASKFKVDTESSGNRQKMSQPGSRKGSREKRPSMIGELSYTSGSRIRNSYGNIQHIHYGNRQYFGNNRAISLDQYTNNRRMSDGLQAVTSDSSVFYNQRQHRSLDHECSSDRSNSNTSGDPQLTQYPIQPYATKLFDEDTENMNSMTTSAPYNIMNNKVQPIQAISLQQASSTGGKSFISRLRQLTGRLSFSFDRDKRQNSLTADDNIEKNQLISSTPATPVTIRNNNAQQSLDLLKTTAGGSGGYTINLNPASPNRMTQQQPQSFQYPPPQQQSSRNRAFSLDVQMPASNKFHRYSSTSSSNYGDSRKSLTFSRHDGLQYIDDSTNSNHQLSSSINDSCLDATSGDERQTSNGLTLCATTGDESAFTTSPSAVIGDTGPPNDCI
jgi:hypothetical protein